MSFVCVVCGKKPKSGKSISHSHTVTNRWFRPNLQRVKVKFQNKIQRVYVCTTCLKSNRIEKVG